MAGREGEFVINLRRNNLNTPWGFRLQGGKEYGTYLSVQRVFNGSPADGQLHRGDVIVAVNNEDVTQWPQSQAQDLILSIGLTLGLVVMRGGGVPYAEARQPPSQTQSVPSFARKPFGQQQQQQQQQPSPTHHHLPQHQPQALSPQLTSKATLQFQPTPFAPSQPSHDLENVRPSPGLTWTPQAPKAPTSSFSAPLQVRIGQPPASKPYSYSPQQGEGFGHDQGPRAYQPSPVSGQGHYQQDFAGGGSAPQGRDLYQREAVQPIQQPKFGADSNHVTYDRNQSAEGVGFDGRNEQNYYEGRKEEEKEDEGDEYQQLTVRDIKQRFNKPDQKGNRAVSRVKQPQKIWTKPPSEGPISPGSYGAPGLRPGQPSSLSPSKPTTGLVHRGPPPSDDDYRKPFSPQPAYGQQRFESPPNYGEKKPAVAINKLGGAYGGIIQPALPVKPPPSKAGPKGAPQKKKDFDPNQSAVYKILLEEEERAKNNPNQKDEEEEEETARRPAQGPSRQAQAPRQPQPPRQAQGSRLNDLLERDAAQIAPYKDKPKSAYQDQVPSYQDQRPSYQDQRPNYQEPRSPYQEPRQLHRGPPAPSHGGPGGRQSHQNHYGGHDYQGAFPQTQYVDGIPTSDF